MISHFLWTGMKVWLNDSSEHPWCFVHRLRSSFPLRANVHQHRAKKARVRNREKDQRQEGRLRALALCLLGGDGYVQFWVRPRSCLLQDGEGEWVWKQALKLMKGSCIEGMLREIYLRRRNWFGAPVYSTVTAKYHERSQNREWIWIQNVLRGRNRARGQHKNIEGSWAGSLYQSSVLSISSAVLRKPVWHWPSLSGVSTFRSQVEVEHPDIWEEGENEGNHSRHHKWHQERMHLTETLLWPCKDPHSPPQNITGGGEQAASGQAWRLRLLIKVCFL